MNENIQVKKIFLLKNLKKGNNGKIIRRIKPFELKFQKIVANNILIIFPLIKN